MKVPILILGGGLAGLTAAIHLSKLGHAVTVIEKNTYPKHKVCGEYISNEVVDYFKWLDLQDIIDQSQIIDTFQLEMDDSNKSEVILPMGGFGISRYLLDDLLYRKAKAQNCQFIHETVSAIVFQDGSFKVDLNSGLQVETKIVVGSFGKRSAIDVQLERSFIKKKSHWMAVKAHYHGNFENHKVGLFPFEGGYCGVSKVENNRLNICYIVQTEVFKKHRNFPEFTDAVLFKNNGLKKILVNSEMLFESPLTISQISFDDKKAVENHVLMIGDAAGLIHPLCGNGMAMAIHSAKIASELIHTTLNAVVFSREKLETDYERAWKKTFKNRLKTGHYLSALLLNPALTKVCMKTITRFPTLFKYIIQKTHGKLIPIPNQ